MPVGTALAMNMPRNACIVRPIVYFWWPYTDFVDKEYNPGGTPLHARPKPAIPRVGGEMSLRSLPPHRYFDVNGCVNGRVRRPSGGSVSRPPLEEQLPTQPALPGSYEAFLIENAEEAMNRAGQADLHTSKAIATKRGRSPSTKRYHSSLYAATPRTTPTISASRNEQSETPQQEWILPTVRPLEPFGEGGTTHSDDVPPTEPAISIYKQMRTTLQVYLSTGMRFVPVKLRSCMTVSTFFSTILAACDLENQEGQVAGVTAHFEWLQDRDAMVIKKGIPDSFAEFLEVVDEAPCWSSGAKRVRCYVTIAVSLKDE